MNNIGIIDVKTKLYMERLKLINDIEKLDYFISDINIAGLDNKQIEQYHLLIMQKDVMNAYRMTLTLRIQNIENGGLI